jgi:RNA polymerase sigma factor (sigma-70 family)
MTLIEKILHGDSQAIVTFYHAHSPKILSYLKRKLPRDEDAQEILNDVFLEAVDSLFMLQKEANVSAWLYQIAHNKIVDFYRKKKIKSVLLSQIPFLEIVASEIQQPEFQFEKQKVTDKIEITLKSLSENYQKILRLHYEEKIPVKDIAILFHLSPKATESMLFRARQSFKKMYAQTI